MSVRRAGLAAAFSATLAAAGLALAASGIEVEHRHPDRDQLAPVRRAPASASPHAWTCTVPVPAAWMRALRAGRVANSGQVLDLDKTGRLVVARRRSVELVGRGTTSTIFELPDHSPEMMWSGFAAERGYLISLTRFLRSGGPADGRVVFVDRDSPLRARVIATGHAPRRVLGEALAGDRAYYVELLAASEETLVASFGLTTGRTTRLTAQPARWMIERRLLPYVVAGSSGYATGAAAVQWAGPPLPTAVTTAIAELEGPATDGLSYVWAVTVDADGSATTDDASPGATVRSYWLASGGNRPFQLLSVPRRLSPAPRPDDIWQVLDVAGPYAVFSDPRRGIAVLDTTSGAGTVLVTPGAGRIAQVATTADWLAVTEGAKSGSVTWVLNLGRLPHLAC